MLVDSFIEVSGLGRRYARRWALADVSFSLPSGSVTILTGHNGAGKSTLLRVLATAIRPDRGEARVAGFDIRREKEDIRRITALLGHHNFLYEALTAHENLAVVCDHLRVSREAGDAALDRVGLGARGGDPLSTFSAGMRKRLSLARLLLQDAKLVLLDEPYGQLDPAGFQMLDDLVLELRSRGTTILMATHEIDRAARVADIELALKDGRVVRSAPLARVTPC